MEIRYRPIGIIHSPFKQLTGMPIQPAGKASAEGTAQIFAEFVQGLKDLEGFSHVILLYHLHRVDRVQLLLTPFLDSEIRGVFATRAPSRPNPIGLSTVRLIRIEGSQLHLGHLDILDGTPLLDIKPYIPSFDAVDEARIGWLEGRGGELDSTTSDDRFL